MRITKKVVHQILEVLDELRKEMKNNEQKDYPYAEWERKRKEVKAKLRMLPKYVEKAASMIKTEKTTGRPKNLNLTQRTMLFLFARLMNKSNRDVEDILGLLEPIFGISVSYKTIERLYSDEEVKLVLHNLFILLLKDENLSGDISGDGTGYCLTVTKHYRTNPKKRSKDYKYAFRLIDIDTGLYIGVGYSAISEMEAFSQAMNMMKELNIPVNSMRLDKYFSSRKVLKLFDKTVTVYIIPKKNISKIGLSWYRVIRNIIDSPYLFLKEYFKRNLSETGFSSDKKRFGGVIRQHREDRQETALFSIALLHNLFFVRVVPK